jgi:hypothetical protein
VTDLDDKGTTITADGYQTDHDTVFPLRTALSYDLAQTFVTGPNCLLVGWPSDLLYLQILDQACRDAGLPTLDPRWSITPVGGVDKVSAFMSLAGSSRLNVAVLIDASRRDQQRLKALSDNDLLGERSLIQISDFAAGKEADLEDLIDPACFLAIVSGVYGDRLPQGTLKASDLKARVPRIIAKVEQYLRDNEISSGRLDRFQLAAYFLREQQALLPKLSAISAERAARMFERINTCIVEN